MGMELVAYIKNRDGEPLKFRENDGHCDNGVFIDFWGGSGWITSALARSLIVARWVQRSASRCFATFREAVPS